MMRLVRSIKNRECQVAIGCVAVLLVGAVLSTQAIATVPETGSEKSESVEVLTDLRVESGASGTRMILKGVQTTDYSVNESSDGNVLTIELANVREARPEDWEGDSGSALGLSVYDGLINQVTSSTFEGKGSPTTRIEVTLAAPARLEPLSDQASLVFLVSPQVDLPLASGLPHEAAAGTDRIVERRAVEEVLKAEAEDPWAVAETIAGLNEKGSAEVVGGGIISPLAASTSKKAPTDSSVGTNTEGQGGQAAVERPSVTTLREVSFEVVAQGVMLHFRADGMLGRTQAFAIEDPDRLVVDLYGVRNGLGRDSLLIESDEVERVRFGAHADKLRIVLDGGPKVDGFQGRHMQPMGEGLVLTVGRVSDRALAEFVGSDAKERPLTVAAVKPAKEPVVLAAQETSSSLSGKPEAEQAGQREMELLWEAPPDESSLSASAVPASLSLIPASVGPDSVASVSTVSKSSDAENESATAAGPSVTQTAAKALDQVGDQETPSEIFGLQYDRDGSRDRIAILADAPVEYEVFEPDSETVVLRIANAFVSDGSGEKVTPDAGGPVSLITLFQQPDVDGSEVRVVVRRAAALTPVVQQRGSILMLDFPAGAGAAEPPPAFLPGSPMAGTEVGEQTQEFEVLESIASDVPAGEVAREIAVATELQDDRAVPASLADVVAAIEQPPVTVPLAQGPVASPASLEGPAAVDLLEEGGLIDGKKYTGRRISLDFKEVLIADVLRLIAEVSDLNIIAGDEVQGTVTIRLVDVPWDQALDVILLTKGLGFVRVGNVLRIAPSEVLKVEEEVRLQERRNKEKLEDLEVKLQPVNYASVADVANLVKRLLSPRGTVNTDVRTNTVIIKDIASVIDEATALIEAIDTQTPQVLIEAKIVEASLDFGRELGSVWDIGTQRFTDGFNPTTPRSDLGGRDFKFQDVNNVSVGNPITSVPTGAINFGAFLLDDKMEVNVHIEAMERSGDGKVISSPRVVTLDNREAIIEQGVSIPFQTFEGGDAKLEFIDAVLSLKVTPHITADKSIIMNLEVTRNAPDSSVSTPTGSPAIAKNQAKTETLIKDGQTLVIGGIYTIEKTTRESRVPYLHKIPLIGAAFKSREISDSRKELLIFVTPRVVVNPALASAN